MTPTVLDGEGGTFSLGAFERRGGMEILLIVVLALLLLGVLPLWGWSRNWGYWPGGLVGLLLVVLLILLLFGRV